MIKDSRANDILFIDACVRGESRTRALAEYLIDKLCGEVTTLRLGDERTAPLDLAALSRRDALINAGALDDDALRHARRFAAADIAVIAAPYWDLSFPALLKCYIEAINVVGVTFRYGADGAPVGLCRAQRLYYVTTAGGFITDDAYGFGYVRALAQGFYGIPDVTCFKAEGLDIVGADIEGALAAARRRIDDALG